MEEYHIGKEIEKEVRRQYPSIEAFAKALHRERQTVYDIFKRAHIATDRLIEVSKLLKRDFFKELSEICLKDFSSIEKENEEVIAERISQLMPDDELQIIMPEYIKDVADEYFLTTRSKPLVVFYDNENNTVFNAFHLIGEQILGTNMIKKVSVNDSNILTFEAKTTLLADMPQKAIEIYYDGLGIKEYDEIILLAERLVSASGKFVILYLQCINALSKDHDGHIKYDDYAERCFTTWHNRIHALVADNVQKDFARRQELFHASMFPPCGYIDRACRLLEKGEKVAARKVLEKALFKRSTYSFKDEDRENNLHRFYATSAIPTTEERKLLEECNVEPCLTMWFDISKEDGEIVDYGYSLSNTPSKGLCINKITTSIE